MSFHYKIRNLEKNLEQKKRELIALDNKFKDNQHQLADWIVFSFKGGLGNFPHCASRC